jgi:hypothetical protein
VAISGLLGFWQERGAAHAVQKLLEMVETRARPCATGLPRASPSTNSCPATWSS